MVSFIILFTPVGCKMYEVKNKKALDKSRAVCRIDYFIS